MKKSVLLNLFTIAPLSLWGYISVLMGGALINVAPEQKLSILIAFLLMFIIFLFYYAVFIFYLKCNAKGTQKYEQYCMICMVVGLIFIVISLLMYYHRS